jgi:hypothetical protein
MTLVVLRGAELLATLQPRGKRLLVWQPEEIHTIALALEQLVTHRRLDRVAIEQVDASPTVPAAIVQGFANTGFVRTPRGLQATEATVREARARRSQTPRRLRAGDVAAPTHGRRPVDPYP